MQIRTIQTSSSSASQPHHHHLDSIHIRCLIVLGKFSRLNTANHTWSSLNSFARPIQSLALPQNAYTLWLFVSSGCIVFVAGEPNLLFSSFYIGVVPCTSFILFILVGVCDEWRFKSCSLVNKKWVRKGGKEISGMPKANIIWCVMCESSTTKPKHHQTHLAAYKGYPPFSVPPWQSSVWH